MEKIIRWSCFTASACIVAAFLFALYISTLLPDTFHVGETGEIRVAGMPFLTSSPALGQEEAAANVTRGGSYNAQLSLGGVIPVKTVRAEVLGRRVVQVCGTPFGIKMFANGAMVVGFSDIYTAQGYQNPAKTAGLKLGDVIVSIAGHETRTNEDGRHLPRHLRRGHRYRRQGHRGLLPLRHDRAHGLPVPPAGGYPGPHHQRAHLAPSGPELGGHPGHLR